MSASSRTESGAKQPGLNNASAAAISPTSKNSSESPTGSSAAPLASASAPNISVLAGSGILSPENASTRSTPTASASTQDGGAAAAAVAAALVASSSSASADSVSNTPASDAVSSTASTVTSSATSKTNTPLSPNAELPLTAVSPTAATGVDTSSGSKTPLSASIGSVVSPPAALVSSVSAPLAPAANIKDMTGGASTPTSVSTPESPFSSSFRNFTDQNHRRQRYYASNTCILIQSQSSKKEELMQLAAKISPAQAYVRVISATENSLYYIGEGKNAEVKVRYPEIKDDKQETNLFDTIAVPPVAPAPRSLSPVELAKFDGVTRPKASDQSRALSGQELGEIYNITRVVRGGGITPGEVNFVRLEKQRKIGAFLQYAKTQYGMNLKLISRDADNQNRLPIPEQDQTLFCKEVAVGYTRFCSVGGFARGLLLFREETTGKYYVAKLFPFPSGCSLPADMMDFFNANLNQPVRVDGQYSFSIVSTPYYPSGCYNQPSDLRYEEEILLSKNANGIAMHGQISANGCNVAAGIASFADGTLTGLTNDSGTFKMEAGVILHATSALLGDGAKAVFRGTGHSRTPRSRRISMDAEQHAKQANSDIKVKAQREAARQAAIGYRTYEPSLSAPSKLRTVADAPATSPTSMSAATSNPNAGQHHHHRFSSTVTASATGSGHARTSSVDETPPELLRSVSATAVLNSAGSSRISSPVNLTDSANSSPALSTSTAVANDGSSRAPLKRGQSRRGSLDMGNLPAVTEADENKVTPPQVSRTTFRNLRLLDDKKAQQKRPTTSRDDSLLERHIQKVAESYQKAEVHVTAGEPRLSVYSSAAKLAALAHSPSHSKQTTPEKAPAPTTHNLRRSGSLEAMRKLNFSTPAEGENEATSPKGEATKSVSSSSSNSPHGAVSAAAMVSITVAAASVSDSPVSPPLPPQGRNRSGHKRYNSVDSGAMTTGSAVALETSAPSSPSAAGLYSQSASAAPPSTQQVAEEAPRSAPAPAN